MTEFERVCRPDLVLAGAAGTATTASLTPTTTSLSSSFEAECWWVDCDCLEVSFLLPVPLSEAAE